MLISLISEIRSLFITFAGMKVKVAVIGLLVVLVAVVAGCGGSHRYDSRLVLADSLMQANPDSALALVQAVDADSLFTEGDRAYRDLLLTQARYKCYITATSDSAINRALAYYRHHTSDHEKITRAYIYKGAVMEELGHPDSAMYYYKTAEATMQHDDYINLGYVNMRMGALYRTYYSFDGNDIEKYELAYDYLKHTDDRHHQLTCLINIGSLYRLNNKEKADSTLKAAMSLAQEMNDTANYVLCIQNLIIMYVHYEMYQKAKEQIHHLMKFPRNKMGNDFYINSAIIYAKLGMLDSAELFLNNTNDSNDPFVRLSRLECLGDIALARNDSLSYLKTKRQVSLISDSLLSNNQKRDILNLESKFDKITLEFSKKKQQENRLITIIISIAAILTVLTILLLHYRKKHRYDRIISELKYESNNLTDNIIQLEKSNIELKISDQNLRKFILAHTAMLREVIEACYHAPRSSLLKDIEQIIKF